MALGAYLVDIIACFMVCFFCFGVPRYDDIKETTINPWIGLIFADV